MKLRTLLFSVLVLTASGTWAQTAFGNLEKVDLSQAEIYDIKEVEFGCRDSIVTDPVTGKTDTIYIDEGITSVKPITEEEIKASAARQARLSVTGVDIPQYGGLTKAGRQNMKSSAYLFSFKYPSIDADGNKVVLSAMMGVPTKMFFKNWAAKPNNVLIACHETITSNWECPTNYNNGGSWMSGVGMMLMYCRYDERRQPCCLVIMPDYEGYGCSADRPHPYLYQDLTARQVVDAVRYGIELYGVQGSSLSLDKLEDNWKSVSLGYSQGGSVSLAVHKFIEQNGLSEQLHFAGSVCGDGPYDPVAHLRYYITDDGNSYGASTEHRKETVSMPIVMPLILKGMCDSNPLMRQHTINEYLSNKFLTTNSLQMIEAKKNKKNRDQYSTDDITKQYKKYRKKGVKNSFSLPQLYGDPVTVGGNFSSADMQSMFYKETGGNVHGKLKEMLTEEGYNYFTNAANFEVDGKRVTPTQRGLMQDLHRALESNNLTVGWTPQHRIAFYHSAFDTVVPFANLCSFVKNQTDLTYYLHDKDNRLGQAGASPTKTTNDEKKADVYINADNSKNDHVGAGKDFFLMGNLLGTSPDYALFKWVIEGKK